jgi:hypothetical protein
MGDPADYDEIVVDYRAVRCPDRRIRQKVDRALDGAEGIVNVGVGTGSCAS